MHHFLGYDFDPNYGSLDKSGYLVVYAPWHPKCWKSSQLVFVHRLVMESHIERILESKEQIHHLDENKLNNNIENLQILSNSDHHCMHHNNIKITYCIVCGKIVKHTKYNKYCSAECGFIGKRKVSDEDIIKIYKNNKNLPMYKIAKLVGISNVGLKKRLVKLKLIV
jgi:predicted nucleic acid-binding Zn ribbon protein